MISTIFINVLWDKQNQQKFICPLFIFAPKSIQKISNCSFSCTYLYAFLRVCVFLQAHTYMYTLYITSQSVLSEQYLPTCVSTRYTYYHSHTLEDTYRWDLKNNGKRDTCVRV